MNKIKALVSIPALIIFYHTLVSIIAGVRHQCWQTKIKCRTALPISTPKVHDALDCFLVNIISQERNVLPFIELNSRTQTTTVTPIMPLMTLPRLKSGVSLGKEDVCLSPIGRCHTPYGSLVLLKNIGCIFAAHFRITHGQP